MPSKRVIPPVKNGLGSQVIVDHRKSTLARGTRWDYHFRWEFLPKLVLGQGAIKDTERTGTSKGLSQSIDRGMISSVAEIADNQVQFQ